MPKEPRHFNNTHRREPYPVATTTSLAPSPATMSHQTRSSTASGAERHVSQSWSPQNDELLMKARQQGMNWQPIASQYFPEKTANACRKRHERLMEKRNNTETWGGVKMETLAKAYNDLREQMWKILADRVGEKWQIVEAKCMEKGLKNLQTAGRTASRRERLGNSFGGSDIEEDNIDTREAPSRRSRSHQGDSPGFNDSALGPEVDQSFNHDDHQNAPYSAGGLSTSTPSFPSPHCTYSTSSPGYPSTIAGTPYLQQSPVQPVHTLPMYHQTQQQQQQTLPSFSSAFGTPGTSTMPSIPSISSVINHPHHRNSAVTTHC